MATDNMPIAHYTSADIATTLEVFANKTQVWPELRRSYGQGIMTFDIIGTLKGSERYIASESWEVHEEMPPFRTMTIGSTITGGASPKVVISFDIAAGDMDQYYHYYPRVGQVFWAGTANALKSFQIASVTNNGSASPTITAFPLDITVTATDYIKAGTVCALAPAVNAGQGTAATTPTHVGYQHFHYYTEILKDALGYENAEFAREKYVEYEGIGLYNSEIARMDMNLDASMEAKIMFGELNTNDSADMKQTSAATGGAVVVPGTQGLWSWIDQRGKDITYTDATDFTVEHFYQLAEYGETVGLPASDWLFDSGGDLLRRVEKSCKSYITNATGSLSEMFTPDAGGGMKDLTVGFKHIIIGGQRIILKPNYIMNNPYMFGISTMYIKDAAMVYPLGMARDGKTGEMIPNIQLLYRGLGQYKDRKRMIAPFVGMGGPKGAIGAPVVLTDDVTKVHSITEFGLAALEMWRAARVYRSDV
jgi:hypothetical protein